MNLHISRRLEPQAVWAIKQLQQSVLRVMHHSVISPMPHRQGFMAGMMSRVITGSGRKGCHGG
jgi:hypothetical protein